MGFRLISGWTEFNTNGDYGRIVCNGGLYQNKNIEGMFLINKNLILIKIDLKLIFIFIKNIFYLYIYLYLKLLNYVICSVNKT